MTEAECKNTSGYFKDPVSGEDITESTPRVIECSFDNGKFVWPCVILGNGNIVKICYKCFTEEEKQLYKAYRGRDGSSAPRSPSGSKKETPKAKPTSSMYHETPLDERTVTKFSPEAAASEQTLAIIACCDKLLGISNLEGIDYALLTSHGSDTVYHVPRCLISNERFEELCNG